MEYVRSYLIHINEQNDQLNSEIQQLQSVQKRDTLTRLFEGSVEDINGKGGGGHYCSVVGVVRCT